MKPTLVSELMTPDVICLSVDDDIVSVDQLLRLKHVRHLPVLDGRKLAGLVTHRDLILAQAKLLWSIPANGGDRVVTLAVRDLMRKDPITCQPTTPADDAIRVMLENKLGCMLVTGTSGELVGIVTEADAMKWASEVMAKQRFES